MMDIGVASNFLAVVSKAAVHIVLKEEKLEKKDCSRKVIEKSVCV